MEPTYSPGDVVVPVPQDRYNVGDVVTFQPIPGDPTLITHRVTRVLYGNDGPRYITRGDANGASAQLPPAIGMIGQLATIHGPLLLKTFPSDADFNALE